MIDEGCDQHKRFMPHCEDCIAPKPSAPREWVLPLKTLIVNDGKGLSAWARQNREDETHVIEYSAYEALEKKFREVFGPGGMKAVHKLIEERDEARVERDKALAKASWEEGLKKAQAAQFHEMRDAYNRAEKNLNMEIDDNIQERARSARLVEAIFALHSIDSAHADSPLGKLKALARAYESEGK